MSSLIASPVSLTWMGNPVTQQGTHLMLCFTHHGEATFLFHVIKIQGADAHHIPGQEDMSDRHF